MTHMISRHLNVLSKYKVLNYKNQYKDPLLLDFGSRNATENFNFSFGERTEVWRSCSTVFKARVSMNNLWFSLKNEHPWQGEMFVLGGCTDLSAMGRKQISRVESGLHGLVSVKLDRMMKPWIKPESCSLERKGDLPFQFFFGTCGTYHVPEEKILLCFDIDDMYGCHR